jgi:DNA processing protein
MAVPGAVTNEMSAGSNRLLRNGAQCVTSAADVLEIVGRLVLDASPEPRGPVNARDELSDTERQVLEAVPVRRWAGPASIAKTAGVATMTVQQTLPPLQLAGLVEQSLDGWRLTSLGAGRPARAAS